MPDTLPPLAPVPSWSVIGGGPHDGETRTPALPDVVSDDGTWIAHAATATAPLFVRQIGHTVYTADGVDILKRRTLGYVYVCVEISGERAWLYLGEFR